MQTVLQSPRSGYWDQTTDLALSLSLGEAPETAICFDSRLRVYSTSAVREGAAEFPEVRVGDFANILLKLLRWTSEPALLLPHRLSSKARRPGATPMSARRTPFVTYPTGTSSCGQRGKSGWKEISADLSVQPAYAVDRSASADRQIRRHVKTFRCVIWVLATQSEETHGGIYRASVEHSRTDIAQSATGESDQSPLTRPYGL